MAYVKADPYEIGLVSGFIHDVRKVGHSGTGDLEITIRSSENLERAAPLRPRSPYELMPSR